MFCPSDYVTLAKLWKEFSGRNSVPLCTIARHRFHDTSDEEFNEFGSPMDFCEDQFLQSIGDQEIFVSDEAGNIVRLETLLDGGRSKLFSKMSVFESTAAARDPNEAGPNNYWLIKMGSQAFVPWPTELAHRMEWSNAYPAVEDKVAVYGKEPFHTLPIAFERSRFTIPETPPPWAIDLIDEHYLPRIISGFSGRALCMGIAQSTQWRANFIANFNFLRRLESAHVQARVGRPAKQDEALVCYQKIFPDGHEGGLKSACQAIKHRFGLQISTKTLARAIKNANPTAGDTSQ